jgi:hypothetical protein
MSISGWMRKSSGRIAIDTTIWRLRRYSLSSFRKMARTRLALMLIAGSPPRPR